MNIKEKYVKKYKHIKGYLKNAIYAVFYITTD